MSSINETILSSIELIRNIIHLLSNESCKLNVMKVAKIIDGIIIIPNPFGTEDL